ncbi:Aldo/keto reductase [Dacryopinax primogenitus]|uniref:Aldo/keto reductase n=1 Tax=Dacryopinax primogenitus (strain DJM 731) TaxID=1858805 RepID=M5FSS0_DACPD|nr:Aldo/keto reductase [Dacryopinax primogenitus]EJT98294.1 Aldo/keto reductase [Dacryopinax primogenitus]
MNKWGLLIRFFRKKERTTELIVQAVLQGFRGIDTACQPKHYREELVGEALRILQESHGIKREELFIQTKYTPIGGQDQSQPLPYDPTTPIGEQVRTSFALSQKNLGTGFIDSLLLHSPLDSPEATLEAWQALRQLQQEGKVGLIGISNCYRIRALLALEREAQVNVVQNRWFEGNGWDKDVLDYCNENDIKYQSFWTLTGSPSLLRHPLLQDIALKHQCTPAQAVYAIAQSFGVVPLAGSTSEKHMLDGVRARDLPIEPEDSEIIRQLIWG